MLEWRFAIVIAWITTHQAAIHTKISSACNFKVNSLWCSPLSDMCVWQTRYYVSENLNGCTEFNELSGMCYWTGHISEADNISHCCVTGRSFSGFCSPKAGASRTSPGDKCTGTNSVRVILYTCEWKNPFRDRCTTRPDNIDDSKIDNEDTVRSTDACHVSMDLVKTKNYIHCQPGTNICILEVRYYQHVENGTCPTSEISSDGINSSCCQHADGQCYWRGNMADIKDIQQKCMESQDLEGPCSISTGGNKQAPSMGNCSGYSSIRSISYTCKTGTCPDILQQPTDESSSDDPTSTTSSPQEATISVKATNKSNQEPNSKDHAMSGDIDTGALVGGVVGAILIIAIIIAIVVLVYRRKRSIRENGSSLAPPTGEEYYEPVRESLPLEKTGHVHRETSGTDPASNGTKPHHDEGMTVFFDTYDHIHGDHYGNPLVNSEGTYDHVPITDQSQTLYDEMNLNEANYDRIDRMCPPRTEEIQDDVYNVLDRT